MLLDFASEMVRHPQLAVNLHPKRQQKQRHCETANESHFAPPIALAVSRPRIHCLGETVYNLLAAAPLPIARTHGHRM